MNPGRSKDRFPAAGLRRNDGATPTIARLVRFVVSDDCHLCSACDAGDQPSEGRGLALGQPSPSPSGRGLGMTAAKAAHEQVRAHERRRGERHEREKGREREEQDGEHGELRDEQKKEHRPEEDDARDPFDSVAHAIERPAARALSVTRAPRRPVIGAALNAKVEMVSDELFAATGAPDRPDRALESAFEPPGPATAPAVAAGTTVEAVR